MMNIEIQVPDKMINNGSTILRAMQNNNTPEADLFVRESIQNSLDAAIGSKKDVLVDFTIGKFETKSLGNELEMIDEKLNQRYKSIEKYLCVRDYNTVGLTGSLSHDDVTPSSSYGNLLKLIYEIGKPQEKEGAGGSWGYGKTIFYRLGMGLVLYYSRIKIESGSYEERLAAVMVENEEKEDVLIPSYHNKLSTGVAWWGKKIEENKTIPITDKYYIHQLLEVFGIQPYRNDETGTAIIMPFINETEILNNNAYGSEQGEKRINYYDDLADYLSYSVQRWYFPRLNNENYKLSNKKTLRVSIDGEMIYYDKQEPYFKLMLDLYNYANSNDPKELQYFANTEIIKREPIILRNTNKMELENSEVGNIVYGMFPYKILGMGSPGQLNNPHFLSNLNQEEMDLNEPIITYTRQPGMIVNYEDRSVWTKNIAKTDKDSYLIGIFVLNSNNRLKIDEKELSLEEYIRQGERADHTSWHDHSNLGINPSIVQRIQNNLVNKIRNEFDEQIERLETDNDSRLAKILGEKILPRKGFGKKPDTHRKGTHISNDKIVRSKGMSFKLKLDNIEYEPNKIEIPFDISIHSDNLKLIEFKLEIDTESSSITIPRYEKEVNKQSPLELHNIVMSGNRDVYDYSKENNKIKVLESDLGSIYNFSIEGDFAEGEEFNGEITISTRSLDVRPIIRILGKGHLNGSD